MNVRAIATHQSQGRNVADSKARMSGYALQPLWDLVLAHKDVTSQAWFDGLLPL